MWILPFVTSIKSFLDIMVWYDLKPLTCQGTWQYAVLIIIYRSLLVGRYLSRQHSKLYFIEVWAIYGLMEAIRYSNALPNQKLYIALQVTRALWILKFEICFCLNRWMFNALFQAKKHGHLFWGSVLCLTLVSDTDAFLDTHKSMATRLK